MISVMRSRLVQLVAVVAVLLALAVPAAAQSSLTSVGITELEDAPRLFASAVAEGDIRRLSSYYDENAVLFAPDGEAAVGRDSIARVYARNAQAGENRMVFRQVNIESEGTRGSIIWVWELSITPRGQAPVVITGRSLLYLVKTPFGWKILFDMFQLLPVSTSGQ